MSHNERKTLFFPKSYAFPGKILFLPAKGRWASPDAERFNIVKQGNHEEINEMDCLSVGAGSIVRFLCLVEVVTSHAEGRATDGADGEEIEAAIRTGQDGALQASGEEDQADDPEGQAPCRADASPSEDQSVLLRCY